MKKNCCGWMRGDLAMVAIVAVLSLSSVGSAMRETDQASLLDGAVLISRGESDQVLVPFYIYDKQYLSYWMMAGVLRAASSLGMEIDHENVAYAGNLFTAVFFWTGIVWLVARCGNRKPRGLSAVLLLAVLLSPAVLLNTALLCPGILSGGFLALLAARLGAREGAGWTEAVVPGLLAFAAVAARADALLCLPFLCWVTVRRASLRALFAARRHWAMFLGAVLALATGILVSEQVTVYSHPPMTIVKVIAAFLVFGFGSGFAGLLLVLGVLGMGAWQARSTSRRLFMLSGIAFALFPIAYYGLQLYTPRHFIPAAWIVLFAATLWRGRAMLTAMLTPRAGAWIGIALVISAVAPLVVGIRLPAPARPSPAFTDATLYPTADGLWPMGAYVDFLWKQKRAARQPIDHNQELWASLATVNFEESGGNVPVYNTMLRPYFELAATLQHKRAKIVGPESIGDYDFLYGDERMLTRSTKPMLTEERRGRAALALLGTYPKRVVSTDSGAQRVLRVEPGGAPEESDPEVERRIALGAAFGGNEYRILGEAHSGNQGAPFDAEGHTFVFFSDSVFSIRLERADAPEVIEAKAVPYTVPSGEERRLYCVILEPDERASGLSVSVSRGVWTARAVLPGYMSVGEM